MHAMVQSSPMSNDDIVFAGRVVTTPVETIGAAFAALTAAAWADYRSMLRLLMFETGIDDSKDVNLERRLEFAKEAFSMVIGPIPESSSFRPLLQKYADEKVTEIIRRGFPPSRILKIHP